MLKEHVLTRLSALLGRRVLNWPQESTLRLMAEELGYRNEMEVLAVACGLPEDQRERVIMGHVGPGVYRLVMNAFPPLTVSSLSRELDINRAHVSRFLNGHNTLAPGNLDKIAQQLKLDPQTMIVRALTEE